mgnify:CR=1 FL=1
MKNKSIIFLFALIFYSLIIKNSLANEFIFKTSEVNILDNGNIVNATNGTATSIDGNFIIDAEKFNYNKKEATLIASGNVKVTDSLNKIILESEKINYNKQNFILKASGDAKVTDSLNKITLESEKIIFKTEDKIISSDSSSIIKDKFDNTFLIQNFIYTLNDSLVKMGNTVLTDVKKNNYNFDKAFLNLEADKLIAKDILINFNTTPFQKNNQPRLVGNTATSDGNITEVRKGVFTTCKKNDDCPPWQLSAKKITHDKKKKIIFYKDAWLKIYDVPVFYFPKFFHPDPTVKKQSGFLMPGFQSSSTLGTSFNTPYYLFLAQNKDATLSPRFYSDNKLLLQTEYREINKNSSTDFDFSFINEKDSSFKSHFFSNMKKEINFFNFDETNFELNLQQTSNDNYLKTYKIQSPLIDSNNLLHSFLEINANKEDLTLMTNVQIYEDLTVTNNNDRYQFIYPNYNLEKQYGYNSFLDGNFKLDSSGYIKQYNTNVNEKVFINDLFFNTIPKISPEGFRTSKTFLLKNTNTESENSSTYKDDLNNKLDTLVEYKASFPLIKKEQDFINIINPLMKFRFSPNKSENLRKSDRRLDINNVYSFNRLGTSTSVEGGTSLTYGIEYSKLDELENELYGVKVANIFRPNSDKKLPENNGLNKKTSDIIGQINLSPNEYFKTNYDFSIDENLKDQNYQLINSQIKVNNFVTSFEFLDNKNSIDKSSYISNTTKISNDDNSKSLVFNTRENKTTNATEFYNLMYQYRNDCLIAALEYNKDYYTGGGLKPEENIFFKLTIIPFGQTSTPNLKP